MTAPVERAVQALCEALVRLCGGDVAVYRARVRAFRRLSEDEQLAQMERQIRVFRRQRDTQRAAEGNE